ncbi:hypothetical protein SELMODRAFT_144349 [Selaginella moellendorffii]|uniref:Uncharacterized protein n=1 Tax=Selaginella moellendorffii TaxID=88036 RepID=D8R767_SELML|nr:hypothetical protein SELMODRAFT_144349 [Selaginella moellendorffii]
MAASSNTPSSAGGGGGGGGGRTHFKTPEGRYKLSREKSHPSGLLHYSHGKTVTQLTLAHLKDKPAQSNSSTSNSSGSGGGGMRFPAAVRLLGAGNGSRALGFVGGNGFASKFSGGGKTAATGAASVSVSNGPIVSNFDGEGTYVIFNVGDAIFISAYDTQDKASRSLGFHFDPIKSIHFNSSNPLCHAFDSEAKDGHDLLIGLSSGDVYSTSLRQQLQDPGKKLVGAMHYNKDGVLNNSRCTAVAWIPHSEGLFVVAHADGNLYVYDKTKDGSGDVSFSPVKDPAQFSVSHARSSKSNPIARWHVCQGAINSLAFSCDGTFLATVGRDGYLRIFDYAKEQVACGGKSYFGALLCCAWSSDGKYVLAGGEDDLVQVWSMEDRAVVAWGEGHNSWVSQVAFDPYWTPPADDGGTTTYRFGSVGQDTQLLLWDLAMDEVVMPFRKLAAPGSSPGGLAGSQTSAAQYHDPTGLQPAPLRKEVPKLAPIMAHKLHPEPLSGLVFTQESVLTACHEGHITIWDRPEQHEQDVSPCSNSADSGAAATIGSLKERQQILSASSPSSQQSLLQQHHHHHHHHHHQQLSNKNTASVYKQ